MKKITVWLLFMFPFTCSGQEMEKHLLDIKQSVRLADSVFLVSHEPTAGIEIYDEQEGRYISPPPLLTKNRLNRNIVKESFLVSASHIDRLVGILLRPRTGRLIKTSHCFIPHHAIILYEKNKLSFIDICFGCRRITTNINSGLSEADFDDQKWKELLAFFKSYGVKYEVDGISFDEE